MANIEGAAVTEVSLSSNQKDWIEIQDSLKKGLIEEDEFTWRLPKPKSTSSTKSTSIEEEEEKERELEQLKYVGGVDLSFSKEDPSIACGTLVVLELPGMKVTYHDFSLARLYVPYVPGFLAFREAPLILELLENVKKKANHFYPQLLMVDGNGVLHPRGFGLACHLGVLTDLPAIGIGKNLHHVDGLTQSGVIQLLKAKESSGEEFVTLMGYSGRTWGVAMRSTKGSSKPIFVSIGHRVSLDTAINIVKMTCKYRVPEPIRQADIISRQHLQRHKKMGIVQQF